jgi:predicted nucleic acid-binding protein
VGSLILDASVLIGLLDNADAHHTRAVDDVERADQAGLALFAPASADGEGACLVRPRRSHARGARRGRLDGDNDRSPYRDDG